MAGLRVYSTKEFPTGCRIEWRELGKQHSKVFSDRSTAERFKKLVEAYGNTMPPDDVLRSAGFGYLAAAPVGYVSSAPTFGELATASVEQRIAKREITGRQVSAYPQRLRDYVLPHLGHMPIDEIFSDDIDDWQTTMRNTKSKKGTLLSNSLIIDMRGTLINPVFADAMKSKRGKPPLISVNPVIGVKGLTKQPTERKYLANDLEAARYLAAIREIDPMVADMTLLMLGTGLRWSEVAGLPVRAVDVKRQTVAVVQVLAEVDGEKSGNTAGGRYLRPSAKTDKGWRTVPTSPVITEMLERRCIGKRRDALVFPGPGTRYVWWGPSQFTARIDKALTALAEKLDKRVTAHGLRHSFATMMRRRGADLNALQEAGGWASAAMLLDVYGHANDDDHAKMRDIAATFLPTSTPIAPPDIAVLVEKIEAADEWTLHKIAALLDA